MLFFNQCRACVTTSVFARAQGKRDSLPFGSEALIQQTLARAQSATSELDDGGDKRRGGGSGGVRIREIIREKARKERGTHTQKGM